jgi:hypothetical protein
VEEEEVVVVVTVVAVAAGVVPLLCCMNSFHSSATVLICDKKNLYVLINHGDEYPLLYDQPRLIVLGRAMRG